MAIRQVTSVAPYVSQVLTNPTSMPAGRWQNLQQDFALSRPATRRQAGDSPAFSVQIAKAVLALAEGSAQVRFVAGADPALVCTVKASGRQDTASYRMRDDAIVATGMIAQPWFAAIDIAARLLISRVPEFSAAYGELLTALAANEPQEKLDTLVAHVSDELAVALETDCDLESLSWFCQADIDAGEMDEARDPSALPLDSLFADKAKFDAYLGGEAGEFGLVETKTPGAAEANPTATGVDPNGFVGPQLGTALRFMQTHRHILHHGPTGTGKSFVWELAMKQMDPDFDIDTYRYFVHGSAGLEDIDFVGGFKKRGDKVDWIDGPLVLAMQDGKRFKVEEMNRLPGVMLNVLLGAMDYGRIALTAYDGRVIVAKEGFAVDAMANIGREYTATDEIDPAIMRRFHIKIEYDFLTPAQEVALLRSRQPSLDKEDAETLVRIGNAVREAYEYGGGSDLDVDLYVSPAALLISAGLVAEGLSLSEAIELSWLVDVARTKDKREKVRAMIDQNIRDRKTKRAAKRGKK